MDEYDGYIEPTPERFRHDPIEQKAEKYRSRPYTVSYIKDPLVMDKLRREDKISAKMYSVALMIRDLWYSIGHRRITVNYEIRVSGGAEMSDQRATFWGLYNHCLRAVPPHARNALLKICCDDEWADEDLFREAIKSIQGALADLRRKDDVRLGQYLAFTRGLDRRQNAH